MNLLVLARMQKSLKFKLTRRLRRIHNAWRFQFKLSLVFKVQCFRFGG